MRKRRTGAIFLLSLLLILLGLWLAVGRSNRTGALDLQKLREAAASIFAGDLLAKMQSALAEGKIWFYLSDPKLLLFAAVAFVAAFVAGLAIWRITVMSWKAVKMKLASARGPQGEQKQR